MKSSHALLVPVGAVLAAVGGMALWYTVVTLTATLVTHARLNHIVEDGPWTGPTHSRWYR